MTERSDNIPMQVEVRDFGPIAEADIALRPLTVFVGPSNTGKSYLAMLLYALHKKLGQAADFSSHMNRAAYAVGESNGNSIVKLKEWVTNLLPDAGEISRMLEKENSFSPEWIPLPHDLNRIVRDSLDEVTQKLASSVDDELLRCFGVGEREALIRYGASRQASVRLRQHIMAEGDVNHSAEHRITITPDVTKLELKFPKQIRIDAETILRILYATIQELSISHNVEALIGGEERLEQFLVYLAEEVRSMGLGSMEQESYYLPASRTGIMHAHQVVVSSLIKKATRGGLQPTASVPVLSGVLADFLDQLIRLDSFRRFSRRSSTTDLDRLFEENMLQGAVKADFSEIGYPSFIYRPAGWSKDVPLMNASSMVSELAPIVLYLRHVIGRNDVLIVEEPESHLHPAMQVEITRLLAAVVQAGIHVIVTTHSEWLLETLTNLVQSSRLTEDERKNIPGGEWSLRPDQVGAWMFDSQESPKGSIVKEIPLDPETGTFRTDYETITESLYNDWATIFNSIREKNGQ